MPSKPPKVVAISGFSSNIGKTTLICQMLAGLHSWEVIKLTRGHYRSCGRDPSGCCVSDLLREEAVVRSGREANYETGKDTGRFWDAGANNVHWVIAKDDQVESGIRQALARVETEGVLIEGNSFLDHVTADLVIMCARAEGGKLKASARRALQKSDLLYVSSIDGDSVRARKQFEAWRATLAVDVVPSRLPIFTPEDIPRLVCRIRI